MCACVLQLQTLIKCLDKLYDHLVEVLKRHHQMFSFRTEEGIDYLALHVEYVVLYVAICVVNFSVTVFHKWTYLQYILTVHMMQNV